MTSQEANSIPLGDILSHYGYEPSRRYGGYDMYRSPFRSDTSPSFKVFREENRWYDFGDGTYGRAVDLVMRVENCSFPQAMKELGRMRTSPQLSMPSIRKPETVSGRLPAAAPMTVLKVIPVQNRHLLDYAASRGIDGEIVRKYCVEVHYCFERNPREKYATRFGTVTFCTEEKKSLEERAEEIAGRLLSSGLSDDLKTLLKEAVLTGYDLQKDDFDED